MSQHRPFKSRTIPGFVLPVILVSVLLSSGCERVPVSSPAALAANHSTSDKVPDVLVLREGDDVRISFPGAPNLDTTQRVRTDGRITLSMVGEVMASGVTPADLEKKLLELYASQLVTKEVTVTVVSSTFSVFVS